MGFEVVVRPVVLPNIRPRPARTLLPPADDPEKGFCVIRGNGFRQASTSKSVSVSSSQSRPTETKRRSDRARVYQKDDEGNINKENFIDIDVVNKIWLDVGAGPASHAPISDAPEGGNPSTTKTEFRTEYYAPIQEADNIEVRKRNFITRRGEEFSE